MTNTEKLTTNWLKTFRQSDGYKLAVSRGVKFRSDDEIEQLYQQTLKHHDANTDLHIFAYGSLMWHPQVKIKSSYPAVLPNYYRDFCINMRSFRATPDVPGLMLGLREDHNHQCQGINLCLAKENIQQELPQLWRREAISSIYIPKWLNVLDEHNQAQRSLVFVINPNDERAITPSLPLEEQARRIAQAEGDLGTNREYLDNLLEHLHKLNIVEEHLIELGKLTAAN